MLREFLTLVAPLLLPTAVYLVWLRATRWSQAGSAVAWRAMPWLWLGATGVALTALVLFVVTVHFGDKSVGTYVPPHLENGRVVPAHIDPAPKP